MILGQQPTRSSPRLSKQTKSKAGQSDGQQSAVAGPSMSRSAIHGKSLQGAAGQIAQTDDEPLDHEANDINEESMAPNFDEQGRAWDRIEQEKNKENKKPKRFIDSQPGARKVAWDDDDDVDNEQPDRRTKSRSKRSQKDAQVEDDNEMFVSGQTSPNSRSPKKRRTQATSSNEQRVDAEDYRNSREGSRTGEDPDEQEEEAPVPSQSYQEVKDEAKRVVALNRSMNSQSRVPWTVAECEALVELIAEHGNGYAAISKSDEAQEAIQERHRDQVALKDKARNIKMDYLL